MSSSIAVGITGHRWNALGDADERLLRERIGEVLNTIRDAVMAVAPTATLHLYSPLAEGADRLVAAAALERGYALHAVLPMPRDAYLADFSTPASQEEFLALLARASSVLELPARLDANTPRNRAYAAAGRRVTAESDLLMAIWDGQAGRGAGGTQQMIDEALARGRTVVWIEAAAPHRVQLLLPDGQRRPLRALADLVAGLAGQRSSAGAEGAG